MKTLLVLCLLACSLSLPAQSNKPPLSPEKREVIQAAQKVQLEEIRKQMEAATARAQQQALERQAMLATSAPVVREPLVPRQPKGPKYFVNTNLWYPGLGLDIRMMERDIPGASTNYSPAQLALTNRFAKLPPRPW